MMPSATDRIAALDRMMAATKRLRNLPIGSAAFNVAWAEWDAASDAYLAMGNAIREEAAIEKMRRDADARRYLDTD